MSKARHAPAVPASLGDDVRTVESLVRVPGVDLPFRVARQILDLGVDADYDPDKHPPTAAHLASIERAEVGSSTLHEDPYEETGRRKQKPIPGETEAFKAYVHTERFRRNIGRFTQASDAVADRLERARIAVETTEAGANVRLSMAPSIADRIAAAGAPPAEVEERNRLLPPAKPGESDRISLAAVSTMSGADMRKLLVNDYLPGATQEMRATFTQMPCVNTIIRAIWPLMLVPEAHRQHYNPVEVVNHMVTAGCKYVAISRIECRERLGALLDADHYAGDLVGGRLRGGHEHYDEQNQRTRFVIFHFACVLKPKQTKEEQQKVLAERLVGLAAQAETEDAANDRFDVDDDIWVDPAEQDDDYTGGNDLYNPRSQFIYDAHLVCVESVGCVHRNEAHEPRQTTADRVRMDDSETSEEVRVEAEASDAVPDGIGALSFESARLLVGKYRAAAFMANCQGAHPLYPLCIRGMHFSVGVKS